MKISAPPAGTPQPEVVVDSSTHDFNSNVDVWRNYALPSGLAVERVPEHH